MRPSDDAQVISTRAAACIPSAEGPSRASEHGAASTCCPAARESANLRYRTIEGLDGDGFDAPTIDSGSERLAHGEGWTIRYESSVSDGPYFFEPVSHCPWCGAALALQTTRDRMWALRWKRLAKMMRKERDLILLWYAK